MQTLYKRKITKLFSLGNDLIVLYSFFTLASENNEDGKIEQLNGAAPPRQLVSIYNPIPAPPWQTSLPQ